MKRPIAVLRPEPGNRVTAIAIESRGHRAIRLPLFAAGPVAWEVPDAADYDALIVTSANAMRHGGAGLVRLLELPVWAVGKATAEAARRAGFTVAGTGDAGAVALLALAEAAGVRHALHLAGRERTVQPGGIVADIRTVYASDTVPVKVEDAAKLAGAIVLVQSARAGARLAEIVADRSSITLVAVSDGAVEAAGKGWEKVVVPGGFTGTALIDTAIALAD
jgi:uroporphyrinogen-III synthase